MQFLYQGEQNELTIDGKALTMIPNQHIDPKQLFKMAVHLFIRPNQATLMKEVVTMVIYHDNMYSENYIQQMMNDFSEMLKSAE